MPAVVAGTSSVPPCSAWPPVASTMAAALRPRSGWVLRGSGWGRGSSARRNPRRPRLTRCGLEGEGEGEGKIEEVKQCEAI